MDRTGLGGLSIPVDEAPVAVVFNAVLGEGPSVRIAVLSASVYTTGLTLQVHVQVSEAPSLVLGNLLGDLAGGSGSVASRRLLLGAKFADGKSSVIPSDRYRGFVRRQLAGDPNLVTLTNDSASWIGPRAAAVQYWLRPLPPTGPVLLACWWPAYQVPKTVAMLSGADIIRAAARVRPGPLEPDEQRPSTDQM